MELKGMTPQQFVEILDFVQKHHSFAKWLPEPEREKELKEFPNISEYGKNIKYTTCSYDSRFKDIWSVTFRGFGAWCFSCNSVMDQPEFPYEDLYSWVMAYLKGEWDNEEILKELFIEK